MAISKREHSSTDATPAVLYALTSADNADAVPIIAAPGGALPMVDALVPASYDYIVLTYVTVGNGVGKISTVTYKAGGSGGTTVATLTLTYDASHRMSTVTRS